MNKHVFATRFTGIVVLVFLLGSGFGTAPVRAGGPVGPSMFELLLGSPQANPDSVTVLEDSGDINIKVLENDTGLEDKPIVITIAAQPPNGTATPGGQTVKYRPDANFSGVDVFTYQVCDGTNACSTANVTMTVTPVDDVPSAAGDSATTPEGTPVTTPVLANDSGLGDTPLTVTIASNPAHGTVVVNANNTITYSPDAGFGGNDSYRYTVCDADLDCSTAEVSVSAIVVDEIPQALSDSAVTEEETPVSISPLANDTGLGDTPLTLTIVQNPANGTAQVLPDRTITYTPQLDFYGADSFRYRVCDADGDCSEATVSINITGVNDTPLAANDLAETGEDTPVSISPLANDTGLGDAPLTLTIVQNPANGTAQVLPDRTVTYTPQLNFNGADSFRYRVCDANGDCTEAGVSLIVTAKNDQPVAVDDSAVTVSTIPVTINVLANDYDPDGDPFSLVSFDSASEKGGTITRYDNGTSSQADDRLTYTAPDGVTGPDAFTYTISDGSLTHSATVQMTVQSPQPTPVANNDTYQAEQDKPLAVSAANGVISNDVNVNPGSAPLTAVLVTGVSHGTLDLELDGSFTYTPTIGYAGEDQFIYQATDGTETSNPATATIQISAAPSPLAVFDDTYQIGQDTALDVPPPGVLGNDNNGAITGLVVALITAPNHGALTLNPDGSFSYTPAAGYVGADQFTYAITDGSSRTAQGQVILTVKDTQLPVVTWHAPVVDGERFNVSGGMVRLEVQATDNVAVDRVRFYRWDALAEAYVEIGIVTAAPYAWDFDTSVLGFGWNNIFCKAYDAAGNESARQWIWIYNSSASFGSFLPVIQR